MDTLKFVVLDEEDLEVASTHLQDAVVRVSDVLWRPHERRRQHRSCQNNAQRLDHGPAQPNG